MRTIFFLIFLFTLSFDGKSQFSIGLGLSRVNEGYNETTSNLYYDDDRSIFKKERTALFIYDFPTFHVDYRKNYFGTDLTLSLINCNRNLHWHDEHYLGGGSSPATWTKYDNYSDVRFGYLGLKWGVGLYFGAREVKQTRYQFSLSMTNQVDALLWHKETNQVLIRTTSLGGEFITEYPDDNLVNTKQFVYQVGLEPKYRLYVNQFYGDIFTNIAYSVKKSYRTYYTPFDYYTSTDSDALSQLSPWNFTLGVSFGYLIGQKMKDKENAN